MLRSLERSIKITAIWSFYRDNFPRFPSFSERVLGIVVLPKTAKKSWKFWCPEIVDLFMEDPFKNFWHVRKDTNRSIVFLIYTFFSKQETHLLILSHLRIFPFQGNRMQSIFAFSAFAGISPTLVAFLDDRFKISLTSISVA